MQKVCLVAVDIRSTHNVGSFFRTCDGFGAEIALVGITPRPIGESDDRLPHIANKTDAAIHKTALGAEKNVKWRYYENFETCVVDLKNNGYDIIAIEQSEKAKNIKDLKLLKPTALVVGPEVEGLKQEYLNLCDDTYEIEMRGHKESFNVSVAAGIALYQAIK